MPLVRVHVDGEQYDELVEMLFIACWEVVPAGMNSQKGPLTPGSIVFTSIISDRTKLGVDVFVEIEAFPYEDRENLDDRAEMIKEALSEIFPSLAIAVWPKLVHAGWSSDNSDPDFDGDMSMESAVQRALATLLHRKR